MSQLNYGRRTNVRNHVRKTKSGKVVPVTEHVRTLPEIKAKILKKARSPATDIGKIYNDANYLYSSTLPTNEADTKYVYYNEFQLLDEVKDKSLKDKFAERLAKIQMKRESLKRKVLNNKISVAEGNKKREELDLELIGVKSDIIEILSKRDERERLLKQL